MSEKARTEQSNARLLMDYLWITDSLLTRQFKHCKKNKNIMSSGQQSHFLLQQGSNEQKEKAQLHLLVLLGEREGEGEAEEERERERERERD